MKTGLKVRIWQKAFPKSCKNASAAVNNKALGISSLS